MSTVIDAIRSRTSANNFDPTHVMSREEITELVALATESPSSFNMQNWRFIAVSTPEAKQRLKAAAFNQPKVGDAAVITAASPTLGWLKAAAFRRCFASGVLTAMKRQFCILKELGLSVAKATSSVISSRDITWVGSKLLAEVRLRMASMTVLMKVFRKR